MKLANVLITNTGGGQKSGDPFWRNAEMLLYCALMGYIFYEAPPHEQNFNTLVAMINAMEVREDDDNFKNPVDLLFDALEEKDPDHFAVRQYHKYKLAAGKTAKSIWCRRVRVSRHSTSRSFGRFCPMTNWSKDMPYLFVKSSVALNLS